MLEHDEALIHARQHLYSMRPPVEWVWVLGKGRRVANGWYFNYELEPLRFIREREGSQFGGAPGFLVNDDGTLRAVGWREMNSIEIQKAVQTLGFSVDRFRHLSVEDAKRVYESALRRFVPHGQPRFWWKHFPKSTGIHFAGGDGWKHFTELTPDADERVWFIPADIDPPEYLVWEASVRDIQSVIGECYDFEFYVIQQQLRWLLCQNYDDDVVAVGIEIEDKLRAYEIGSPGVGS